MNYQSGDRLKNRYLSNDAFTSLKNKLGGRSITSLGNRKNRSYRIANEGLNLFEYKSLIYRIFLFLLIFIILIYVIPQTRYFIHGYVSREIVLSNQNVDSESDSETVYNIAPVFLKTDKFISKQKDTHVYDGMYVYDAITKNLIGVTTENSSSTINIRLFSDSGFKNNFLIEQISSVSTNWIKDESLNQADFVSSTSILGSTTTVSEIVQVSNKTYESYVFEGLGYGQIVAKVPPKTVVNNDSYIYERTVDGLKPFAKIINVDEDNKSTFTIIYAQLITSPQNVYKVFFK